MFPEGEGIDPASKWSIKVSKFFNKHELKVQSHDFRVTQATDFYKKTGDLVKTQDFMGHSHSNTTEKYIKRTVNDKQKDAEEYLLEQMANKRQRTMVDIE